MKMKTRRFAPLLLAVLLLGLTACGYTAVESTDGSLRVSFPSDMTVLTAGQMQAGDVSLTDYGADPDTLTAFVQQGGLFFAAGEQNSVKRQVLVTRQETDLSRQIWQLRQGDTAAIQALQQDWVDTFEEAGLQVLRKGEFQQGQCHFVFVDVSSLSDGQANGAYACTVYNGAQYTVLYQADAPLTDALVQESDDVLGSFELLETLSPSQEEPNDRTTLRAVLVAVLLAIVVTVVVLVARMLTLRKKNEEKAVSYTPQFSGELTPNSKKKGRKS